MTLRRAARIDANQPEIVAALRKAGALVEIIGQPVDLLVGIRGQFMLMEIKDGKKVKSAQELTAAQKAFFAKWAGYPHSVVDGVDAALRAIGVVK